LDDYPVSGQAAQIGGSASGYQANFVSSTALASPGYDGQPAVYLYIAALEVNVLNCRGPDADGLLAVTSVPDWVHDSER